MFWVSEYLGNLRYAICADFLQLITDLCFQNMTVTKFLPLCCLFCYFINQLEISFSWLTMTLQFCLHTEVLKSRTVFSCILDKVFRNFYPFGIFPSYTRGCKTTLCITSETGAEPNTSGSKMYIFQCKIDKITHIQA